MDCNHQLPLSKGIIPARTLEWAAMPFSRGVFPTQGLNSGLLYCRQMLYQLSHQGSPRILEWVAYPFPGEFPDPGVKLGLLHCRRILYQLSYLGSPRKYRATLNKNNNINHRYLPSNIMNVTNILLGKIANYRKTQYNTIM